MKPEDRDLTKTEKLSRLPEPMSRTLREIAAPGRVRLRTVPPERYLDFSPVGRGGMGIVYRVRDSELHLEVAFKVVRPDFVGEEESPETPGPWTLKRPERGSPAGEAFARLEDRFLQEAWVTSGLEHSGIVPVHELGRTQEGVPYYTMRLVPGRRTLRDAIREAEDLDARMALLEPFLKVCDTVRYAHARGVIHRHLKPSNVALGEYGEVLVLDWGIAKVRDRPDLAESVWRERIRAYREERDLRTVAGRMGTPGYMAPEAASRPGEVDERSDVYGLGVILHEILTGKLPGDEGEPEEPDTRIPADLSRICARARAERAEDRHAGAGELAEAIRAWHREQAIESEAAALSRDAETAFAATEGLVGEDLLRQLDRVTAFTSRILELRPDHQAARDLVRRSEGVREQAIGERERAAKGRLLKRVAAAALVIGLALAVVVVLLVDAKRQEAERERQRANEERDAKAGALTRVLRLADSKKVRDLVAEADHLWPLHPDTTPAMKAWIDRAKAVIANRQVHEDALAAISDQARPYTEDERLRDHTEDIARLGEAREAQRAVREEIEALVEDESEEVREKREALGKRTTALEGEIATLAKRVETRAPTLFTDPQNAPYLCLKGMPFRAIFGVTGQ